LGDVKANKRQNSLFCQKGKDPGQNLHFIWTDLSSVASKARHWYVYIAITDNLQAGVKLTVICHEISSTVSKLCIVEGHVDFDFVR